MIRYYVNEEKRTVVAVAEDCKFDAILQIIKRHPGISEYLDFVVDKNIEVTDSDLDEAIDCAYLETIKAYDLRYAAMNDKYTAKAVCHPDDVFDESVGKRIAGERLQEKLICSQKRAVQRWKNRQESLMKGI